jgi:hypothetical protein
MNHLQTLYSCLIVWTAGACTPPTVATFRARDATSPDAYAQPVDSAGPGPGGWWLQPSVCAGSDLTPEFRLLGIHDLLAFFDGRGLRHSNLHLRSDLELVTITLPDIPVLPLRVAALASNRQAGRYLHEALLEHGEGAWGVYRGNVAVLGPVGTLADIISVSARTRLACWGTLLVAGGDDTFAVPGGYMGL